MNEILFIARSVTHAQRMVRALEQCGIRSFLFRAPAGLTGGAYRRRMQLCGEGAGSVAAGGQDVLADSGADAPWHI